MNEKRQGNNINIEDKWKEQIKAERYRDINNQKNYRHINLNSNEKPTEKYLSLNKQSTNYYSTKVVIDTSKNYRQSGQEVKKEKDIHPKLKRYQIKTERETPKEEKVNYSFNNVYISKFIKEEKNEKKSGNTANNIVFKSIVVKNKKSHKAEDDIVKKVFNFANKRNNNSSNQLEKNKYTFRRYRIASNKMMNYCLKEN